MEQIKLIIIGAGNRGQCYAGWVERFPQRAAVVAVAEPRDHYRNALARQHNIPEANIFHDWQDVANRPKFADAVVIATQDTLHAAPAVAFARLGYHILLEKPMANNEQDCRQITDAAIENRIIFAVGHVMRYTPFTRKLKEMIDSGAIGDLVTIQLLEPVGYWHQAHSFVRGNWRKESQSAPMLLAKSCHDLDWLRYIMGSRCVKISSFGNLHHFRKANQPPDAAERCLDCTYEPKCPYSAKKIYLDRAQRGEYDWPVDIITSDLTVAGVTEALRTGPYGRCVYKCDNDVVDHQVVNMLFADGKTASFTMTAFHEGGGRRVRVFGTRGSLCGDSSIIEHRDFLTDQTTVIETNIVDAGISGGHGGGDQALMESFVTALAHNDPTKILSGPRETLESHLMVFAAEKARREGIVVNLDH